MKFAATYKVSPGLFVQVFPRHSVEFRKAMVKHDLNVANRKNSRMYGVNTYGKFLAIQVMSSHKVICNRKVGQ